LEQQTATAEILRIISSSPTDVRRVFDTIVRNFVSLCGSIFGTIFTFDGKLVHLAGAYGFSPAQLNEVRKKYPVQVSDRSVLSARAILAKAPVHIQDTMSDPHYDRQHAAVGGAKNACGADASRGRSRFDAARCARGIGALKSCQAEWSEELRVYKKSTASRLGLARSRRVSLPRDELAGADCE
jgi:hypothetical protein